MLGSPQKRKRLQFETQARLCFIFTRSQDIHITGKQHKSLVRPTHCANYPDPHITISYTPPFAMVIRVIGRLDQLSGWTTRVNKQKTIDHVGHLQKVFPLNPNFDGIGHFSPKKRRAHSPSHSDTQTSFTTAAPPSAQFHRPSLNQFTAPNNIFVKQLIFHKLTNHKSQIGFFTIWKCVTLWDVGGKATSNGVTARGWHKINLRVQVMFIHSMDIYINKSLNLNGSVSHRHFDG